MSPLTGSRSGPPWFRASSEPPSRSQYMLNPEPTQPTVFVPGLKHCLSHPVTPTDSARLPHFASSSSMRYGSNFSESVYVSLQVSLPTHAPESFRSVENSFPFLFP